MTEPLPPVHTLFAGANFHRAAAPAPVLRWASRDDYRWPEGDNAETVELPRKVTLGFRQVFWKVFSRLVEVGRPDAEIEWLGAKWTLRSIWLADSNDVDMSVSLYDKRNMFVFFELRPHEAHPSDFIQARTFALGLNEQSSIRALLEAVCALEPYRPFLRSLGHARDFPGRFLHSVRAPLTNVPDFVCILAFYSYCLLFIWQIGRYQEAIEIDDRSEESVHHLSEVLKVRASIINVERRFLTTNVTNDPELKAASQALRRNFGLRDKFIRFLELNESIEKYIATASQIAGERRSRRINYLIFLFTIVSIPLALIQALLSYNANNVFVADGFLASLFSVTFGQFIVGTAVVYLAMVALVHLVAGSSLTVWQWLEAIGRRLFRAGIEPPGNQKKRIFSGAPPRQNSANSAARNKPPAT